MFEEQTIMTWLSWIGLDRNRSEYEEKEEEKL